MPDPILEAAPLGDFMPIEQAGTLGGEFDAVLADANALAKEAAQRHLGLWLPDVPFNSQDRSALRPRKGKVGKPFLDAVSADTLLTLLDGLDATDGRVGLNYRSPQRADQLNVGDYTIPPGRNGGPATLNSGQVVEMIRQDVTLQIRSLDQSVPALCLLAQAAERACGAAISMKGFIASGETKGLGRHVDLVEMWAIQLEGSKSWTQWSPSIPWYDQRRPAPGLEPMGQTEEVVLEPGDSLVVPRGWFHDVKPRGNFIASLSIVIDAPSVAQLLEGHLRTIGSEPSWLKPIHESSQAAGLEHLFGDETSFEMVLRRERARTQAMIPPRQLNGVGKLLRAHITGSDAGIKYRSAIGGSVHPIEDIDGEDSVVFGAGGRAVRVARKAVSSLGTVFGGEAFTAGDLSALSVPDARRLLGQLWAQGLVTSAEEATGPGLPREGAHPE